MADLDFTAKLSALVSKEMADAHGDAERVGVVIERCIYSAAFAIAIGARGDPRGMDEMLKGAEAYLYEAATGHQKLGAFMAVARGR